jgi:hypothetical protein
MTMKRIWGLVLAAGSLAAAAALQDGPGEEMRQRHIQTLTGTVKSYTPAERIVIVGTDGAEHTLKLDAGARVADGVAEGETVAVAWLTESTGRKRVTSIAPFSARESGGSASSAPPSRAYASATEGSAMSTTPSGPMSDTPRPAVTATPGVPASRTMPPGTGTTPGSSPQETPGYPARRTPGIGSR